MYLEIPNLHVWPPKNKKRLFRGRMGATQVEQLVVHMLSATQLMRDAVS